MNKCINCINKDICEWACPGDDTFTKCSDYLPCIVKNLIYEDGPQGKFLTIKLQLDTLENNNE